MHTWINFVQFVWPFPPLPQPLSTQGLGLCGEGTAAPWHLSWTRYSDISLVLIHGGADDATASWWSMLKANWVKQSSVCPASIPVSHKSFGGIMLVTSLRMNFFWTEKLHHKFKTQSCYLQWMPLPLLYGDSLCIAKQFQTDSKLSYLEFHKW